MDGGGVSKRGGGFYSTAIVSGILLLWICCCCRRRRGGGRYGSEVPIGVQCNLSFCDMKTLGVVQIGLSFSLYCLKGELTHL
jgi:hypothetical protein